MVKGIFNRQEFSEMVKTVNLAKNKKTGSNIPNRGG
jgi:hypothetical protein